MSTKPNWNRFGRIVALCYTGYPERYNSLKTELERVGLGESVEYVYDFPTPLKGLLKPTIPTTSFTGRDGPFSCTLAHYKVIKQSYELGYESILIIEDDVRFLKDVGKVSEILDSLPADCDYAQFERAKPYEMPMEQWLSLKNGDRVNGYWIQFRDIRGGGCYALSRTAMTFMVEQFESVFNGNGEKLQSNDFYVSRGYGLKRMFCYPSVAVQTQITESNSDIIEYWRRNEMDGIRFGEYNTTDTIEPIGRHNFLKKVDEVVKREEIQGGEVQFDKRSVVLSGWDNKPILGTIFKENGARVVKRGRADAAILWGYNTSDRNTRTLSTALRYGIPVVFCEPAFISSGTTWADKKSLGCHRIEHGVMMDQFGQFFDATHATSLEKIINGDFELNESEMDESRRLIRRIVSNKVSKYNHQPLDVPNVGRVGKRKVLVIDQSYGDCSISRGMASEETFRTMLKNAVSENPDADVLVKTHPDSVAGKKGPQLGYYQYLNEHDYKNVFKITQNVNPYSLMERVDTIYVCSSQFGFEGLMAGKKVKVFGMPWYAGWGVTEDEQKCARRTRKRTIEELFYIFYVVYTIWGMPEENRLCTIDEVIDKMIQYRKEILEQAAALRKGRIYEEDGEW